MVNITKGTKVEIKCNVTNAGDAITFYSTLNFGGVSNATVQPSTLDAGESAEFTFSNFDTSNMSGNQDVILTLSSGYGMSGTIYLTQRVSGQVTIVEPQAPVIDLRVNSITVNGTKIY